MSQHNKVVDRQFGAQANAYLTSSVHANGKEFTLLQTHLKADANTEKRILDLGSGAGHVSFHVAPFAQEVVAYDLSESMLKVVSDSAREKGLSNITTEQGIAEALPFADASFDYVISRYSAHHWQDVGLALREARRVLKPGGTLVVVDVMAPGNPLLDTYLQTVEVLRDTSHVRDYSAAEWYQFFGEANFMVTESHRQPLRLEFESWIARMRTPDHYRDAILALQRDMGQEVRDYFQIDVAGSFTTDVLMIWATKC